MDNRLFSIASRPMMDPTQTPRKLGGFLLDGSIGRASSLLITGV